MSLFSALHFKRRKIRRKKEERKKTKYICIYLYVGWCRYLRYDPASFPNGCHTRKEGLSFLLHWRLCWQKWYQLRIERIDKLWFHIISLFPPNFSLIHISQIMHFPEQTASQGCIFFCYYLLKQKLSVYIHKMVSSSLQQINGEFCLCLVPCIFLV